MRKAGSSCPLAQPLGLGKGAASRQSEQKENGIAAQTIPFFQGTYGFGWDTDQR